MTAVPYGVGFRTDWPFTDCGRGPNRVRLEQPVGTFLDCMDSDQPFRPVVNGVQRTGCAKGNAKPQLSLDSEPLISAYQF